MSASGHSQRPCLRRRQELLGVLSRQLDNQIRSRIFHEASFLRGNLLARAAPCRLVALLRRGLVVGGGGGVRRGDVLLLVAVSVVGSLVGERGPGLGGDGDAGRCGHRVQAGLDGGAELDEMLAAKKGGA